MSVITINHVTKSFGDVTVLKEFTEEFQDGEFITFLGPSGCGKTTMLRIIAGFEKPTTGEIRIDGRVVSSKDVFVPPEKRGIGMVFQSYAVWPHMNVFDNVAYPLKIQKVPKAEIKEKVEEILEIVHLSQYANRMPSQLSGGQQQRVALGRALIGQPKLLLLDEPLSNLDAKLRESMRFEIKEIQRKLKITVVYVTHDQVEAMSMGDNIILMDKGIIMQRSAPTEMYQNPQNVYTARFIGTPPMNILQNALADGYQLGFRPERVLFERPEGEPAFRMNVHVVTKENLGSECIYSMTCDFGAISVKSQDDVMERDVTVYVKYSNLYIFDAESNRAPLDGTVRRQVEEISARVREGR